MKHLATGGGASWWGCASRCCQEALSVGCHTVGTLQLWSLLLTDLHVCVRGAVLRTVLRISAALVRWPRSWQVSEKPTLLLKPAKQGRLCRVPGSMLLHGWAKCLLHCREGL
jgi:hypothetical protein